jgi:YtkA-like
MIRTLKLTMLALLMIIGGASFISAASFAASHWPVYRFEIVDQTIHAGHDVVVNVRLIKTHNQAPNDYEVVTNATIADPKLQMLMNGMAPMPAQVKALPPDASGTYRFASDLTMAGDWQLDLSATVPGETEPVTGTLKFQVVK